MNSIRSAILLLVYSVTLLTVPVSARSYAFIVQSSENTEKEALTNSTFEHRESSSIKVTGKSCVPNNLKSYSNYRQDDNYNARIPAGCNLNLSKVPIYIMHCIYRC